MLIIILQGCHLQHDSEKYSASVLVKHLFMLRQKARRQSQTLWLFLSVSLRSFTVVLNYHLPDRQISNVERAKLFLLTGVGVDLVPDGITNEKEEHCRSKTMLRCYDAVVLSIVSANSWHYDQGILRCDSVALDSDMARIKASRVYMSSPESPASRCVSQ